MKQGQESGKGVGGGGNMEGDISTEGPSAEVPGSR